MKNNLKQIRKSFNMSGIELAKRVDVAHSMIYMIENGSRNPSMALANKISKVLKTSVDEIFFNYECHEKLPNNKTETA